MPLDYRKWDHIEVSDDEDDTHPNIDTPSLFKWRHEARVQRMEDMKNKTETVENEKKKIEAKLKEVRERVKREEEAGGDNLEDLKKSLNDIEKQKKARAAWARSGGAARDRKYRCECRSSGSPA